MSGFFQSRIPLVQLARDSPRAASRTPSSDWPVPLTPTRISLIRATYLNPVSRFPYNVDLDSHTSTTYTEISENIVSERRGCLPVSLVLNLADKRIPFKDSAGVLWIPLGARLSSPRSPGTLKPTSLLVLHPPVGQYSTAHFTVFETLHYEVAKLPPPYSRLHPFVTMCCRPCGGRTAYGHDAGCQAGR